MGAVKRMVSTNFWLDSKVVEEFTPEDKYFFLYLLTNPHTTQLGIYELNIKQAAFELGYSSETVGALLERFEKKYNMINYNKPTKEIVIKNFLIHSIMKGGKPVEDCLAKEIGQVKEQSLISILFENLISKEDIINETVKIVIKKYLDKDKKNDNEKDNDNDNENERVVPRFVGVSLNVGDLFNQFWEEYPKKVGKGKCVEWFNKNKPSKELIDKIVLSIESQKKSQMWKKDNGQFIPNPFTWLNQGRWEDELEEYQDTPKQKGYMTEKEKFDEKASKITLDKSKGWRGIEI